MSPTKLTMTLSKMSLVPNKTNSAIIEEFRTYMKAKGSSEQHQNNNLKVAIAFAKHLRPNVTFYQPERREQIIFSVEAKGISNNACNIGFPSVVIQDDGNGKMINWPHPIGFNYAMGCLKASSIDSVWTFGDKPGEEIILNKSGSYTVITSVREDATAKRNSLLLQVSILISAITLQQM